MDIITYEMYGAAIRNRYLEYIGGDLSTLLANPTSTNLKNACLKVSEKNNRKGDINVLREFLEIEQGEEFRISRNFEIDKFKPISNFLKGKTDSLQSPLSLELIAILIDFQPRPYSKFRKYGDKPKDNSSIIKENVKLDNKGIKDKPPANDILKKIIITISISFGVLFLIFGITWQRKKCMIWVEDHYEPIACGQTNGLDISLNEEVVEKFRKVSPDTIGAFFENGKALFWYSKSDGQIELFTQGGKHPEKGNILRPVTEQIVRTHFLKDE